MAKARYSLYAPVLVLSDLVAMFVFLNLAMFLRGLGNWGDLLFGASLIPGLSFVGSIYLIDGYRAHADKLSSEYTSQHLIAGFFCTCFVLLGTFTLSPFGTLPFNQSRAVVILSFALQIPISILYRRALYLRLQPKRTTRIIIYAGSTEDYASFAEECSRCGMTQTIRHIRLHEHEPAADQLHELEVCLQEISQDLHGIEAIVIRESGRKFSAQVSNQLEELYFRGVPTYTQELFQQVYWRKIPLYRINLIWLFQEGFKMARNPFLERLKRASDIVLSSIGLLLISPLLIVAAILIKWEDGGPVFFRQTRIGRNRRPFTMFKLRSMRVQTEGKAGSVYTEKNDSRITRIGHFLRKSRLDEFPQLINVLKGDMSMIGPRAEWDILVSDYEKQIPCYHYRHLVRPGITGWAQINYPYGANLEDTLHKLEYDLYYIRHFSFTLDASIVLKTIHVMLFGKGR